MANIIEQMVDYSRQTTMNNELNNIQGYPHVIVGCGGIGYWLALQLAMMGAQNLTLIDGDKVEPSNLNRLPIPLRMSGEWKVKALKAQIRMLRPQVRVVCMPVHITEDTMSVLEAPNGYVWDCTDDARIQQLLSRWCARHFLNYTKAGYEGWEIGLYPRMTDTWMQDDYTPGYTTSRANVVSSMMAAGLAIMYAGRRINHDVRIDLKRLVTEGNTQEVAA
jgi:hypothetical protein